MKINVIFFSFLLMILSPGVWAAETKISSEIENVNVSDEEGLLVDENTEVVPLDVGDVVHSDREQFGEINYLVLDEKEDDLYADVEIKPLNKEMSREEKITEDVSDVFTAVKETLPELNCSDERLKKQIENFIYHNINQEGTHSVVEKRLRVLLVKNLKDFVELEAEQISGKNSFAAQAAVMELRVNRRIPVYKVCESKGNDYDKFESVYAVIYQYQGYYKVIVSNLMPTPKKMDEATFIYSWQ